jgi:phosphoglycerol transferase MdoB-like AlkP superfamily enzyme
VTGTVYADFLSPVLILCLFKAKAHVCILKIAEDGLKYLLCLFPWCSRLCINLLSLPSQLLSLYLVYRAEGPDLTWKFGPKVLKTLASILIK